MYWKIEKEIFGSLPGIQVFISCLQGKQTFNILQLSRGLPVIMALLIFMKIKPGISGSEEAVTMGNLSEILQLKKDFPIILLQSLKTKQGNYGLAQGAKPSFMTEKHLPL